jgi:hypothetical protein
LDSSLLCWLVPEIVLLFLLSYVVQNNLHRCESQTGQRQGGHGELGWYESPDGRVSAAIRAAYFVETSTKATAGCFLRGPACCYAWPAFGQDYEREDLLPFLELAGWLRKTIRQQYNCSI